MAVKVGSFAKSTSLSTPVSQAITGVGFKPQALLLWTAGATSANAYEAHVRHSFGLSDGSSSGCIAASLDDATANTNAARRTATAAMCIINGDGTVLAEADLTSFGADGFTLSWTTNDASATIINYMAIGGADLTGVKLLSWQLATSTGDQAVTGAGFQPEALIGICGDNAALDSNTAGARSALWFDVGTSEWSTGWSCRDGQSSGEGYQGTDTAGWRDLISAANYVGTVKSLDADGFTVNWSNAASSAWYAFTLCLAGGDYKTGTTTKTTGAAPVTQTISGLGMTPEGVLLAMTHTGGQFGVCLALGAGDGTTERCALITDEYGIGTIEAKHYQADAKALVQDYSRTSTTPDQATDSECDLSGLASGEFTLTWTTNDANACQLGYFALATGVAEDNALFSSGASTSTGTADLQMGMRMVGAGASSSAGSAAAFVLTPGMARVTQAGLSVDASRDVPARVTQAGLALDAQRDVPARVTQAGLALDAQRDAPARVTQIGLLLDGRYERPEATLNCWEFHVEDIVGHHLAFLDGATDKAYLEALSDAGGGTFTISAHDPKATTTNLAVGNIVKVRYRNVDIGAWMIENIEEVLVGSGESAAQAYKVSGRGLLGLLEEGIVYPGSLADAGTAEREFAAVTKASILLDLWGEFVARGGGCLNTDFTATHDSAATAWSDSVTLNFKAGQTLLDVARNLAGLGLELTCDPDRTLQAWVTAGTDRSAEVIFRHGQSVMGSQRKTEGVGLTNAVLGEGQGVFVESTDATSIATYRRRESYLPVRNTADTGMVGTANALLLAGWKDPRAAYTLEVLAEPFYPFFNYHVGDTVAISIPDKFEGDYRVLGISVTEEGGPCDLRVTLEINDLATEYLQKLQLALDATLSSVKPGAGAASGLASSGTEPIVGAGGTGLGADAIKDTHIDWGAGPGQVDADDVPFTPAVLTDWTGSADPGDVDDALDQLASRLTSSSHAAVTLGTDADAVLGLTGQQVTLDSQNPNTVLAGPTSGPAADPAFRALVEADLPATALLTTGSRDGATSSAQQFVTGTRHGDDTHHADFDGTGHLTFTGNARPWRDALTDALNLQQNGTGVSVNAAESAVDFAYNAVYHATFSLADAIFCNIQLNHDKDLTSAIYPHIHWFQAANYTPNLLFEYRWQVNGGTKTTGWTKLKCTTLAHAYSSGTIHQISYAAGIAVPVGTTLSDILQFRIYRDTGDASGEFGATCPYNTGGNRTVSILAFDVHFMLNSLGSTDEYTK